MAMENEYVLSVVVGTFNRLGRLRECIESIVRETSIPIKTYVTDAGSTDGTVEYLKGLESDSVSVILHERKLGQAKAYNEIFARISTPYVCWLSDDNVIINRGLEQAVRILDVNPMIGMVGLKVRDVQGPFFREPYIGGISETGVLNVNQGVLRTNILQGLGGFSEEFMDYGIDPDLTVRVLYAGHDVVYTKDVAILHWRDWGEGEVLSVQMAKQEKYKALYQEKYSRNGASGSPSRFRSRAIGGVKRLLVKSFRLLGFADGDRWARDWYNIMLGRYISPLDPLRSFGKDYHLLQRCDRETVAYYAERFQQGFK